MDAGRERERAGKLTLDQLALALHNLGPNHFLMPVFTAIICVMFYRWVPAAKLETWFVLLTLSVIPLGLVAHRFRSRLPEPAEARLWILRATLAYLLFATTWASMCVFLWKPHDDLNHLLIVLLLGCTVAGNGALVGASRPLSIVVYAVYGTAQVAIPLREGGLTYNGIAALSALFVGYLVYMSTQIYRTSRDMLLLRDDKSDLIVALAHAKTESDVARERAEAASRTKSQFLANMSHELRTPLNAILGFSELISSRAFAGDVEKHYEYADLIHGSGEHLLTLINDVLDLAKIEAGGFELRESEVDLGRLIEDAAGLMAPRAEAGGCRLNIEVPRALPTILADERAIRQIVLNLLSNAIKFTQAGGWVTAFARLEADGEVAFGVADSGIGIALEDQMRVFQSFGQGRHDVAIMDRARGSAFPIAKGLVEAHGGTIALESEIGVGTRVTVYLPATRALRYRLRAPADSDAQQRQQPARQGRRAAGDGVVGVEEQDLLMRPREELPGGRQRRRIDLLREIEGVDEAVEIAPRRIDGRQEHRIAPGRKRALDELQDRGVVADRLVNGGRPRPGRDHEHRHAEGGTDRVAGLGQTRRHALQDRRRDVVEEAAALVIGEEQHARLPGARRLQRIDDARGEELAHVGRRGADASDNRRLGHDPRHGGQRAGGEIDEELRDVGGGARELQRVGENLLEERSAD